MSSENKAEMLKNTPEMKEKIIAEVVRLAETGEAASPEEAMAMAIKNVAGIEVPIEKMKVISEEAQKIDLEELDEVAGGKIGHIDNLDPKRIQRAQDFFRRRSLTGPLTVISWLNSAIDGINFCIDGTNKMFGLDE